ncbi:hypothetical protein Taro_043154 [Colocasia esculenta]|uniref:RING-type domain-containing protein n=1 Tax=Colocasia esculenta TaxID=4460 RepID=A0A843WFP2_COLES|nr:hypothetical protein [Colocasia esculenta]
MGLSSHLSDVSNDSIPILLVATAAGWVSYLRSFLLCLLHSLGFHHDHRQSAQEGDGSSSTSAVGSGLAGLILLAEQLISAQPAFSYGHEDVVEGGEARRPRAGVADPDCVVCLCGLREGDRVRRLSCCRRVFHCECLDGWFDQSKLSCPLCRAPLVSEEHRAEAARRVGAELADWLAPY